VPLEVGLGQTRGQSDFAKAAPNDPA